MCTADVEVDDPIAALLDLLYAVELQRVDDALVLRARDFVVELSLFQTVDPVVLKLVKGAALGVLEEDGGRPVLEYTLEQVHLVALAILIVVLAVQVCALV